MTKESLQMPDERGYFGEYGGQIIPPPLIEIMNEINDAYDKVTQTEVFQQELQQLYADYVGRPSPVYSIASGLDYPGVGPQHCHLKDIKRVSYEAVDDKECLDAFMQVSRLEGIIPALESAHAIAHAMKIARDMSDDETILVNLSGRGDKDADFVAERLSL